MFCQEIPKDRLFSGKTERKKQGMQDEYIRTEAESGLLRVTVLGEIDHHAAKGLREAIDREIFYHRPKELLLCLSEVGFMDSSGLGLILGRYTRMQELGGTMKILDPTPQIVKILRLAGLEKKIPVEHSPRAKPPASSAAASSKSAAAAGGKGAAGSAGGRTTAANGIDTRLTAANGNSGKAARPAASDGSAGKRQKAPGKTAQTLVTALSLSGAHGGAETVTVVGQNTGAVPGEGAAPDQKDAYKTGTIKKR